MHVNEFPVQGKILVVDSVFVVLATRIHCLPIQGNLSSMPSLKFPSMEVFSTFIQTLVMQTSLA